MTSSRTLAGLGAAAAAVLALGACSPGPAPASSSPSSPATELTVTSTSFDADGPIPVALTCDGADTSPQLSWSGGPAGTVGYAVTMTDPDADGFVHWVVVNLPPGTTTVGEGASATIPSGAAGAGGAVQGLTSFGKPGYRGPCPPSGTHHYVVTVYALGSLVEGTPSVDLVRSAALASGTLTGTYAHG